VIKPLSDEESHLSQFWTRDRLRKDDHEFIENVYSTFSDVPFNYCLVIFFGLIVVFSALSKNYMFMPYALLSIFFIAVQGDWNKNRVQERTFFTYFIYMFIFITTVFTIFYDGVVVAFFLSYCVIALRRYLENRTMKIANMKYSNLPLSLRKRIETQNVKRERKKFKQSEIQKNKKKRKAQRNKGSFVSFMNSSSNSHDS
jgi:MFS superfamily sulfate permease-like transporter